MRVVVALGGNALLRRGEPLTEAVQRQNVDLAAAALAPIAREHNVVITHGNGPQVGLLALESEAYTDVPPYGLDLLGAESQGMIGLLIEQALRNQLPAAQLLIVLTSVLVDAADPAFAAPSKPIGPVYTRTQADELVRQRGWSIRADGNGFRRVVPSPRPQAIPALAAIRLLVEAGVLVICGGGGGIPMIRQPSGRLVGVEGVIDKDFTSALLAEELDGEMLLLLTDVAAVQSEWGTSQAQDIRQTTPSELRAMTFAAGSMGPKVEAACMFVEHTGRVAAIGAITDAGHLLKGSRGTIISPN